MIQVLNIVYAGRHSGKFSIELIDLGRTKPIITMRQNNEVMVLYNDSVPHRSRYILIQLIKGGHFEIRSYLSQRFCYAFLQPLILATQLVYLTLNARKTAKHNIPDV